MGRESAEVLFFIDMHNSNVSIAISFIIPMTMWEKEGPSCKKKYAKVLRSVRNEDMVRVRDYAKKEAVKGAQFVIDDVVCLYLDESGNGEQLFRILCKIL